MAGIVVLSLAAGSCAGAGRGAGGTTNGLAGEWTGHLVRSADTLAVTLRFARDSGGAVSGEFSSDRLRVHGVPFTTVEASGCCAARATLRGDATTSVFDLAAARSALTGTFTEGDASGTAVLARATAAEPAVRETPVAFANGPVELRGTLFTPASAGRHPAVIMLHGSGAEGRWANRYLARKLAEAGVAALTYDKRGVGESTGDWRTAAFTDLVADAVRGIGMLGQRPDIDPTRIGAFGHSQGGTMLPMVAEFAANVAFLAASGPSGVSPDSLERFSLRNAIGVASLPPADRELAETFVRTIVGVAYAGRPRAGLDSLARSLTGRPWYFGPPPADDPYWAFSARIANYEPEAHWRVVNPPVALFFGGSDERVPVEASRAAITGALAAVPGRLIASCVYPGADHTLRVRRTGDQWPRSAPGYVDDLVKWVRVAARLDAAPPQLSAACR